MWKTIVPKILYPLETKHFLDVEIYPNLFPLYKNDRASQKMQFSWKFTNLITQGVFILQCVITGSFNRFKHYFHPFKEVHAAWIWKYLMLGISFTYLWNTFVKFKNIITSPSKYGIMSAMIPHLKFDFDAKKGFCSIQIQMSLKRCLQMMSCNSLKNRCLLISKSLHYIFQPIQIPLFFVSISIQRVMHDSGSNQAKKQQLILLQWKPGWCLSTGMNIRTYLDRLQLMSPQSNFFQTSFCFNLEFNEERDDLSDVWEWITYDKRTLLAFTD